MWKKVCLINKKYDSINEPLRMVIFLYSLLIVWGIGILLDQFIFEASINEVFSYGYLLSITILIAAIIMRFFYFKTPQQDYADAKTKKY